MSRVANRAIASVESIPSAIPSVPATITPFHLSTRDRVGPSHGSVIGMGVSNDLGPDHEDLLAGMTSSSKIDHLIRCIDSLESTYQSHLKQRRRIEMIQLDTWRQQQQQQQQHSNSSDQESNTKRSRVGFQIETVKEKDDNLNKNNWENFESLQAAP